MFFFQKLRTKVIERTIKDKIIVVCILFVYLESITISRSYIRSSLVLRFNPIWFYSWESVLACRVMTLDAPLFLEEFQLFCKYFWGQVGYAKVEMKEGARRFDSCRTANFSRRKIQSSYSFWNIFHGKSPIFKKK